jgi:CBS-domain-containing membrane protein
MFCRAAHRAFPRIPLIVKWFYSLAGELHSALVMVPLPSVSLLAGRLLEPLSKPWAVVGGGMVGGGAFHATAIVQGARLAWRLLTVLLTL